MIDQSTEEAMHRSAPAILAILCSLLLPIVPAAPAWAQDRIVDEIIVEQSSIIERFSPPRIKGSASLQGVPLEDRIPPELAAQRTFVLRNIRIEGATELPPEALRPLWVDLVGRELPVSALYDLTDRITQQYLQAGILMVATVPLQDLAEGDIRIVVFDQSYIRTVETKGDYPGIRRRIDPYIKQLIALKPLRLREVERILLLMADIAGMNVEGLLRRPDVPGNGGALTLEIRFEKRVVRLSLDNRGSDEVGPIQAFGTYQENDLLGAFESTTVTGATIPNQPRELLFGQLAQDFPFGFDGLHVGYRADIARSRPGGNLADADVDVTSINGEAYASYPVLRTIKHSAFVSVGLRASDTDVDVAGQRQSRDRYRWLTAGVDTDHDIGFGLLAVQAEFRQGIDAFDATQEGAALASREIVKPDFQLTTVSADLSVELSERVSLIGRAAGQYAFGPLPNDVQLRFGGDPFGRAFDSGDASGDSGVVGSLEMTVDTNVPIDVVQGSEVYGFVDYGALSFRGDDRDGSTVTLGSAGLGFRAFLAQGFAIDASLAVPIEEESDVEDRGTRMFVSVKKRF